MPSFKVFRNGDAAVVLEFQEEPAILINELVVFVGAFVRSKNHAGVLDVVEGFRGVTVVFDPLKTDVQTIVSTLEAGGETEISSLNKIRREVTVPVCYGGLYGPDLSEVARFSECSEGEVVSRHQKPTYRVSMIGFLPGFPYMGAVNSEVLAPRKELPRVRVAKGSVGIADRQTGVYPMDSPGGWQIIGRCPLEIFNLNAPDPFFFHVGDNVRFEAVTEDEYCSLRESK